MAQPQQKPLARASVRLTPQDAFLATWQRSGPALLPEKKAGVWRVLEEAHSAPGRFYHNLEHVTECLAFVGMCQQAGRKIDDLAAVEWALWFHDAVYDPRAQDNEERSAALATELLTDAGLPPASVARVASSILATRTHLHGPDRDERVVVDADLGCLGVPPPRYSSYVNGVRREYAHLSDAQWTAGRAKFLRSLLEREQLYATDVGKSLEQQARANLSHELQLASVGLLLDTSTEDELPSVREDPEEEEQQEAQEAQEAALHTSVAARA